MAETQHNTTRADIVGLLRAHFADTQARNQSYSLRALARYFGLQPSTASELLSGKRSLTKTLAARIVDRLGLPPEKAASLLGTVPKRTRGKVGSQQTLTYLQISNDEFNLVSDWFYLGLLSLAETEGFNSSPKWIAERLGISVTQAKRALNTLLRLKLLITEASSKNLKVSGKKVQTTTDIPSSAHRRHHLQGLELAQHALLELPLEERDFGSATIAADPDKIPEGKARIRKFRKELTQFLESGKKREVFKFNTHLFPISRPRR